MMTTSTPTNGAASPGTKPEASGGKAVSMNPARTVVITGASGGIGAETCRGLIRDLPNLEKIVICCRDVAKGEKVASSLVEGDGASVSIDVVPVDLSDSSSVVSCVGAVEEKLGDSALDLFIANAGVMACPLTYSRVTQQKDGETRTGRMEEQYFVNFVSQALMIDRLITALLRSDTPRVVLVSSMAVAISRARSAAPTIAEKNANNVSDANYARWGAYGDSKLAMSLYTKALSQRFPLVEFVSLHPGVVQTELGRHILPKWMQPKSGPARLPQFISRLFGLLTPEEGAALTTELSTAKPGNLDNGGMYIGLGGKKADKTIIPLLSNDKVVEAVYDDTKAFIDTLV